MKQHSSGFIEIVSDAKTRIKETDPETVRARIAQGDKFYLIDVREDREWDAEHIQGAEHLGKGIIECYIEKQIPDKQTEIILYCGGGLRSALAADNLQKMGYTNVLSMDGGFGKWKSLGFETEL